MIGGNYPHRPTDYFRGGRSPTVPWLPSARSVRATTRATLVVLAASTVLIGGCSAAPGTSGSAGTVLRVGLSEESGALDPHAFTGNFVLLDAVYEPLVTYAEGGS